MAAADEEESLLRAVALQNAQSILQARQQAEQELLKSKAELERKTTELATSLAMMRATLESTADGILVTDGADRVTGFNNNLVRMWGIPRPVLDSGSHQEILRHTSRYVVNPERFRSRVEEIYSAASIESFDLLELTDGRAFERFSRLQVIEDHNVGRVWSFRDITERRRAEEALVHQSERHRITLSSIGDGVITTDTAGRVTSLNPVAEELTGWQSSEALGAPLIDIFHILNEETRQPVENPAIRALRDGRIVGLANHTVLVSRDGTVRAIDDSAAPIRDEHEVVVGVVLIFRDVSASRRAEEARLHLAAVVDSSDDAIVSKDLNGVIHSWNDGARRIFGYSAEDVIGKSITILIPPDKLHEEVEILRRLRAGQRVEHFETIRVRKDGRPIHVSVTTSPVRDRSGQVIGASKIARDISRRKRSEETNHFLAEASAALAVLSDYQSTLQKVASVAVPFFADCCAVDILEPEGSVRRLALVRQDREVTGGQSEESRGTVPAATRLPAIMKALKTGKSTWIGNVAEVPIGEVAESERDWQLLSDFGLRSFIAVPLASRTGTIGALTFFTTHSGRSYDIDDLRIAEDLAHRVVIAIENSNLLAALKDSDQRKDEFLAMLAHELRNPLAPIRNAVQVVRMAAGAAPESQWATEVIDRQVHQMTRLVDDLLDLSRITSGNIQLQKERVDLAAVVSSAVDASRPQIDLWGHEFWVSLPPEPIELVADMTRLSQVLLNLLNNAAKYTNPGGRIWLTVVREDDVAVISVRDTGVGISPEMLPRIFEMFTQVDRSLERAQGGLGIGLTLVKRLVEMHGGTVRARSSGAGQGSEFVVRLPITTEIESKPAGQPQGAEPAAGGRPRRILVTDDNRDAADSLAMLLRMQGHEVRTAYDGESAVALVNQLAPEFVLLDIGLPKLNGYDAARRIRADLGEDVVIIAVTGWGKEEDRRMSREAGFNHHFTKPVDLQGLSRLLAEVPSN